MGTVEPRYKEPLYSEVLGITNEFVYPSDRKKKQQNKDKKSLDITKPRYSQQILPVRYTLLIYRCLMHSMTDTRNTY